MHAYRKICTNPSSYAEHLQKEKFTLLKHIYVNRYSNCLSGGAVSREGNALDNAYLRLLTPCGKSP